MNKQPEDNTLKQCTAKLNDLAQADVADYLEFERTWRKEPFDPSEVGQEALGFVVSKLLQLLAPVTLPPNRACVPEFQYTCCLHGVPAELKDLLRKKLEAVEILCISAEDAILYCVSEYKEKYKESGPGELSDEGYKWNAQSPLSVLENQSTDILEQCENESMDSLPENLAFLTKETQTPAVLPEAAPCEKYSACVVGQQIAKALRVGVPVAADLIAKALVSFLARDSTLTRDSTLLTRNSTLLTRDSTLLTRDSTLLTQDSTLLTRDSTLLTRNSTHLTRNSTLLTRDSTLLTRNSTWRGLVLLDFPNDSDELVELESHLKGDFVLLPHKRHPTSADIRRFMSKLVPFTVNLSSLVSDSYFDDFIKVDNEYETRKVSLKLKEVFEFYARCNKFVEMKRAVRSAELNIESVVNFIMDRIESAPVSHYGDLNTVKHLKSSESSFLYENKEDTCDQFTFNHADFFASPTFLALLGQLWQSMEFRYLTSLQKIFAIKREENGNIIAFGKNVEALFVGARYIPSTKLAVVDEFQADFNQLSAEERQNVDVKARLHKEVANLRTALTDLCIDNQMLHKARVTDPLSKDKWSSAHLEFTCNAYFAILNEEIRRFTDTMQLIADYYLLSFVSKAPRLERIAVKKNLKLMAAKNKTNFGNCVKLVEGQGFEVSFHAWIDYINTKFETYVDEITAIHSQLSSDHTYTNLRRDLLDQMKTALTDEMTRILLRVDLIQRKLHSEVEEFENWYVEMLNVNYLQSLQHQEDEMHAVGVLCDVFSLAVEEETPLSHRLVLSGVKLLLGQRLPLPLASQPCLKQRHLLTPTQVEQLMLLFTRVAPHGFLPFPHLTCLLQCVQRLSEFVPSSLEQLTSVNLTRILHTMLGHSTEYSWRDLLIHLLEIPIRHGTELTNLCKAFIKLDPEHSGQLSWPAFQATRLWFETVFLVEDMAIKRILFTMFQVNGGSLHLNSVIPEKSMNYVNRNMNYVKGSMNYMDRSMNNVDRSMNYVQLLLHLCKCESYIQGFSLALCVTHLLELAACNVDLSEREICFTQSQFSASHSQFSQTKSESPQITYSCFRTVVGTCLPHHCDLNVRSTLEKSLNKKSSWPWPNEIRSLLKLLHEDRTLLSSVEKTRKFQACSPKDLVAAEMNLEVKKRMDDWKRESKDENAEDLPAESEISLENGVCDDVYLLGKVYGLFSMRD